MNEEAGNEFGVDRHLERLPRDVQAEMRKLWSDEEWAALSLGERKRLFTWMVHLINSDISEAMDEGTLVHRVDSHVSRIVSLVDEQGWRELLRIQADALEAIFEIRAESAERLAESGGEAMAAMSTMICCELPQERPGLDASA